MDGDSWLSWLIIVLLLAGAAYFAVAETGMASVGRIRLKTCLDKGDRRAEKALYIQDNFDLAVSTILIGTNILHISVATLVTVMVTRTWGISFVTLGTIVCTFVVFLTGEMLPKTIAKKYSERCALSTASSLCFFLRIFKPLARLLAAVGNKFSGLSHEEPEITVTEDELYDVIDNLTDEGGLDEDQGDLVRSALEFADVPVESVLTSRVDVAALNVNASDEEIRTAIRSNRHSRIPVYEGSIDNIIGILQIREYIKATLQSKETPVLRSLLDEAYYVHQSAAIDEVLSELSRRRLNMAVVSDNYGGTLGIVTVEDILEELVGEIWDEEDIAEETFRDLGSGSYELSADLDIEDMFELLDYEDPEDGEWNHKRVGEWAYEQFDALPQNGDSFTWHRLQVTVQDIQRRRIRKLCVKLLPEEEKEGEDE